MRSISLALLLILASCQKAGPNSDFEKIGGKITADGLVGITEVATANTHSCAITELGVKCWGDYEATQVPKDLKNPRNLVLGEGNSCVITDNGIRCWGWTSRVQQPPSDLKNPRRLAADGSSYCALTDEGVRCWAGMMNPPMPLRNPTDIAVGTNHACAITDDGVQCWGSNEDGKSTPPAGLKHPRQIAVGWSHSCAVTDDGVKCWGGSSRSCSAIPPVNYSGPVRSLVASKNANCMIAGDKSYCWGSGFYEGECGQVQGKPLTNPAAISVFGDSDSRNSCTLSADGVKCEGKGEAVNVPSGLKNPRMFAAGGHQVCAQTDDGLKCWGLGRHNELDAPAFAAFKSQPISLLALGSGHHCAMVAGQFLCWGFGWGVPRFPYQQAPSFQGLRDFRFSRTGSDKACALTNEGVVCMGTFISPFVAVPASLNPTSMDFYNEYGCALTSLGVKCWGSAEGREVAQPPLLRHPENLVAGDGFGCAIEGNNVKYVRCWGNISAVPAELDRPHGLVAGERHACVLTDNGVVCWGSSQYDQTLPPKNLRNPRNMIAGSDYTCAETDEGFRCWGRSSVANVPTLQLGR